MKKMASFASSATTGGARKNAWTKKKKGERLNDGNNNGQLHIANATSAAWANFHGLLS